MLFERFFIGLHFIGHAEEFQDVFIGFKPDGTQQRGYREFFLTVDIREHHVIDVGGKFHPGSFEGDHAGGIDLGSVGVNALPEEYPGRTVQLGNHHTLGAVDHKSAAGSHVGDITQEHVLHDGLEIDVFFVVTAQAQFGLEGNGIGQPPFDTLFDGVTGRVNKIIQEFQHEDVPRIRDREILLKYTEKPFVITFVGRCL